MITKEAKIEIIYGIQLVIGHKQQIMAEYMDDISLTVLEEEENIRHIIYTLKKICLGLELILN